MTESPDITALRERLGGIAYGGDYNPEQWPEHVWAQDMRLMSEAGVSMVSVGIFAWSMVEPRPGDYRFGWFDRVLDLLADNGIAASLATMTAAPPPWLVHRHPEILPVRADGTRLHPGARQGYCPSSPVFREHAARLAGQVAARYAGHPALALWHIGNEYGCHIRACYCDVSATAFREWLTNRYGDIDALNDAWSTTFWSQRYGEFSEVWPPRTAPTFVNPAQQLDWARFCSDTQLELMTLETEAVRAHSPDVPVTTNHVPLAKTLDIYRWSECVDVVSYDSYPDPHDPDAHLLAGLSYDVIRSARHGQPWLLMEQAPNAVNWRHRNGIKPPGVMRLWSWQAVAHGADAVLFFQWRQSRGGAEKFHSAMLPHGGEHTRTFREISGLGAELAAARELAGARADNRVALVLDWNSWWALELDAHPSSELGQLDALLAHYRPLFEANVGCDVVHPSWDLSGYDLVLVPNLYLIEPEVAAGLHDYVHAGGTLLVSYFSGIVDGNDRVHEGGYPGPLRELLGVWVPEFRPLAADDTRRADVLGTPATVSVWTEEIVPEGARVHGTLAGGDPVLTGNTVGAGSAWYLGAKLDADGMRVLVGRLLADAGVAPAVPGAPAGVQAVRRSNGNGDYLLLLNHAGAAADVPLPAPAVDVLTGEPVRERVHLPARGVSVLRTCSYE